MKPRFAQGRRQLSPRGADRTVRFPTHENPRRTETMELCVPADVVRSSFQFASFGVHSRLGLDVTQRVQARMLAPQRITASPKSILRGTEVRRGAFIPLRSPFFELSVTLIRRRSHIASGRSDTRSITRVPARRAGNHVRRKSRNPPSTNARSFSRSACPICSARSSDSF